MELMAKVHLRPKPTVYEALTLTLQNVNGARQYVLEVARTAGVTGPYLRQRELYRMTYSELRERFDIGAQLSVIIINEIAGAAQRRELEGLQFQADSPIAYDERSISWQFDERTVSIWTVNGRKKNLPFECGPRQLEILGQGRATSELVYFNQEFYIFTQCRVNQLSSVDLEEVWK